MWWWWKVWENSFEYQNFLWSEKWENRAQWLVRLNCKCQHEKQKFSLEFSFILHIHMPLLLEGAKSLSFQVECETIKPYDVVICSDCVGGWAAVKMRKKVTKNYPKIYSTTDARYCYSSSFNFISSSFCITSEQEEKSEKVILMQNLWHDNKVARRISLATKMENDVKLVKKCKRRVGKAVK